MMVYRRSLATAAALAFLLVSATRAVLSAQERNIEVLGREAGSRVALVVGNSAYENSPLRNPQNDAADMANALAAVGFDVIHVQDQNHRQMKEAVRRFTARLRRGEVGLFYYAGHGVQVDGRNYLIPVGADIRRESDVEFEAMDAGWVLAEMEEAGNPLNIVILDACRNNPFPGASRAGTRGLASMDAPSGSLIAYSTAPGSVADDGDGRNGLYTQELLRHVRTPGLKLEDVFKRVRISVMERSDERQTPWESSSLTGDFYFHTDALAASGQLLDTGQGEVQDGAADQNLSSEAPPARPLEPAADHGLWLEEAKALEAVESAGTGLQIDLKDGRRFQRHPLPLEPLASLLDSLRDATTSLQAAAFQPGRVEMEVGFFGLYRTGGGTWGARAILTAAANDRRLRSPFDANYAADILIGDEPDEDERQAWALRLVGRLRGSILEEAGDLSERLAGPMKLVTTWGVARPSNRNQGMPEGMSAADLDALTRAVELAWGVSVARETLVKDLGPTDVESRVNSTGIVRAWERIQGPVRTSEGVEGVVVRALVGRPSG